jgi:N-acetylglucosamine-6-phosphate deacetylase
MDFAAAAPLLLTGGTILQPDKTVPHGSVLLSDGHIKEVWEKAEPGILSGISKDEKKVLVFDTSSAIVSPSLTEFHIHGCGGHSFHDCREDTLIKSARFLAERGILRFLPTLIGVPEMISAAAGLALAYGSPDRIPGLYVEGPFVSPEKRGGIPPECIKDYSPGELERILAAGRGKIKVLTAAPEKVSREYTEKLGQQNIIAAAGHSKGRLQKLSSREFPLITHLFNGMSGVSHKEPGLAHWGLIEDSVYVELNGDGHHLHPAAIDLVLRCKNREKIILISDAAPPAGLTEGATAVFNGEDTTVSGLGVYNREGTLVGSRLLLNEIVGKMIREHGLEPHTAVSMASSIPNNLLGIENSGKIRKGFSADVSVFTPDFSRCLLAIHRGKIIHNSGDLPMREEGKAR